MQCLYPPRKLGVSFNFYKKVIFFVNFSYY